MSKLRKPQSPSTPPRPMVNVIASPTTVTAYAARSPCTTPGRKALNDRRPAGGPVPRPRSATEQYWAARALTAETLLNAQTNHQREIRTLTFSEETKRLRELATLAQANGLQQAKLEKLVVALLAVIVLLIVYIIPTRLHQRNHSPPRSFFPSHFTIPILSPFTSVIEHEASVVGARTIAIFLLALAGLAYALFRHWIGRARRATR